MKIALPNNGTQVNQHFGRSASFVVVEIENNQLKNSKEVSTRDLQHQHKGLADLLLNEGVSVVITGGIGAGALSSLEASGMTVIRGASGEFTGVIEEYLKGTLKSSDAVCNHHGDEHHH